MKSPQKEKKKISESMALSKLAALCSRSEQCSHYCREKLAQWEIPTDATERIIGHLIQEKYINDQRYALFFVKDKYFLNHWGKKKIELHLIRKKISKEHIEMALKEIPDENYSTQLEELLTSKLKKTKAKNLFDLKGKLFRFAAGRGFENDIIFKAIEKIIDGNRTELLSQMDAEPDDY